MRYHFLLFVLLFALSCAPDAIYSRLETIETIIEEYPDSALIMIREIPSNQITNKKSQAMYSLLHAMALDKNHIDITSDSVISPALSYYRLHGSSDDKMKAFYYRGVAENNASDWEEALNFYVRAERFEDKCNDRIAVGRLHKAKMLIYKDIFEFEKADLEGRRAAFAYLEGQDTSRYFTTLLECGILNQGCGCMEKAKEIVDTVSSHWPSLSMVQKSKCYYLLLALHDKSDINGLTSLIQQYLNEIPPPNVNWMIVADSFLSCGEYEKARYAVDQYYKYRYQDNVQSIPSRILAEIYMGLGDYYKSAKAYAEYVSSSDKTDLAIFSSDAKFVEEKYKSEIRRIRHENAIGILALCITVIILICIIVFHVIKSYVSKTQSEKKEHLKQIQKLEAEKERYTKLYDTVLKEKKRLQRTKDDGVLSKEVLKLVEERLNVLNRFVMAHISGTFSKNAAMELDELMRDQNHFLESTRMSFALSHHGFLKYLEAHGLDNWEIGCCCLYCIGLNGSEIADYLQRNYYYKISAKIRRKLGLDRSTNLNTFLLKKIREFDSWKSTL